MIQGNAPFYAHHLMLYASQKDIKSHLLDKGTPLGEIGTYVLIISS